MLKPTAVNKVLEVRYERGYRYLDRCGEAMLILQELLPDETGAVWMPEDITPSGAKIKCPDLDLRISFDATRFYAEHVGNEEMPNFAHVAGVVFAVISGRFDLRSFVRFGFRRFWMIGTDSTEEAQLLSLKLSPIGQWPGGVPEFVRQKSNEISVALESDDGSEGLNCGIRPVSKLEAVEQIDERTRMPAKMLEKGQKEALIAQLQRKAAREKNPTAGVLIDVDYYQVRPEKPELRVFFETAVEAGNKVLNDILAGR